MRPGPAQRRGPIRDEAGPQRTAQGVTAAAPSCKGRGVFRLHSWTAVEVSGCTPLLLTCMFSGRRGGPCRYGTRPRTASRWAATLCAGERIGVLGRRSDGLAQLWLSARPGSAAVSVEASNLFGGQEGVHELGYVDFSVRTGGVGSLRVAHRRESGVYGIDVGSWYDHHPRRDRRRRYRRARYAHRTL